MKKRIISTLLATLLGILSIFCVVSCGGGPETPSDDSTNSGNSGNTNPVDPDDDNLVGEVMLNDFETYRPDFQVIRVLNGFGVIDVNKDAKYVKSGKASAKVRPLGSYGSLAPATAYVPLYSKTFGFDHRDLTRIRQVKAEVYNAESKQVPMTFGIVMEAVNTDIINKTNAQKYSLKPGWNTVTYDVDVSVINILYDVTKAEGVYFGFESSNSRVIEDAPTVYIDDLRLVYSATDAKIVDLLSFDANEICNFDKTYQRYVIYAESDNPVAEPEYSIVKTAEYGVEATSGSSALCITTKPGDGKNTWPRIVLPSGYMMASALTGVKETDYDSTYFCFDLYALEKPMVFYPEFFDTGYNDCYNKWACDASVGKWTTYRIKLSDLKPSMVKTPGFFRISWNEYDQNLGELTFLIDSIRIEK